MHQTGGHTIPLQFHRCPSKAQLSSTRQQPGANTKSVFFSKFPHQFRMLERPGLSYQQLATRLTAQPDLLEQFVLESCSLERVAGWVDRARSATGRARLSSWKVEMHRTDEKLQFHLFVFRSCLLEVTRSRH